VVSGFRRDVGEICTPLGYYATMNYNSVPTFRDKLPAPYSRVLDVLTLEDGSYRLSRNVGYRITTERCVISQKSADLNPSTALLTSRIWNRSERNIFNVIGVSQTIHMFQVARKENSKLIRRPFLVATCIVVECIIRVFVSIVTS
jgi:hypothetical protein